MPFGELENEIFLSLDSANNIKLSEMPSIENCETAEPIENLIPNSLNNSHDITLEMKPADGFNATDIFLLLSGLCTIEQIQSNNWRKLHSLPMKRRRK